MSGGDPSLKSVGRPGDVMTRGVLGWGASALSALMRITVGLMTDNACARWDRATGKLQDSLLIVSDTGATTGITSLEASGRVGLGAAGLPALHDNARVIVSGTQTPTTTGVAEYGAINLVSVTGNPNQNIIGEMIRPAAFVKAGSGTHPMLVNLWLETPVAAPSGAGLVANTAMLYISGISAESPTGTNWSIWSTAGINRFDGGIQGNPSDASRLKVFSSNLVPDTTAVATLGDSTYKWLSAYVRGLDVSGSSVNQSSIVTITNSNIGTYGTIFAEGTTGDGITNWPRSFVIEAVPAAGGNLVLGAYTGSIVFQTGSRAVQTTIDNAGLLTLANTTLLATSVALTNGAAAQAGTLLNSPAAGNPTKWIPINDNGTTRYIPAW